jgi:CO dehydrogenase/acetyl-CoA synthase gamma subunit (corrinoid Fe-S protein)
MEKVLTEDANTFVGQFEDRKSKDERIQVLEDGKARLEAEVEKLSLAIEMEMGDLMFGKEVAMKMDNVLFRYESRFSKENLSKLKLADEIDIKNLLREKLHRELQGFRTSTAEYAELDKVNPDDILNIVQQINSIVG